MSSLAEENDFAYPRSDENASKSSKNIRRNPIVKQTLVELYQDRSTTGDVKFLVDSEGIYAHRCILAAISPKYKVQFYGLQPDQGDVYVDGITATAFKEFLQFFYLEEVILSVQNIEGVLNLAQQSLVGDFVDECIEFLKSTVAVDNLCTVYHVAMLFDIKELTELCESEISANAQQILGGDDFINSEHEVLVKILQNDTLHCREIEVFDACIAWARRACQQNDIDGTQMENLRTELGDAITQIRFSSMKIDEFAAIHKAYRGLFTPEESDEIIYMIGNLKCFEPQIFNQQPRQPPSTLESRFHLECFRILPAKAESIDRHGVQMVTIEFCCNKGIQLKGFAMVGKSLFIDVAEIYVGVNSSRGILEYYPTFKLDANEEGYAVMFDKPINVRLKDGWVEVKAEVKYEGASALYQVAHLMRIPVNDYQSDDFVFKFNETDGADLVTRLFFSPSGETNE